MTELTRRNAFQSIAGVGLLAAITPLAEMNAQDKVQDPSPKNERDCVMASGMTDDEADCWDLTAKLAGKLLSLPELHPMEKEEIASVIHVLQYRLLSRPTYRRYKDLHKMLPEK